MGLDFGALIPALAQGASSYMQGQRIGEHDREQRDALLRQRAFEEWARKQQLAQSADALKQRGEIDQQKLANAILLRQLQEQGSTQRTGMVQDATTDRTGMTNTSREKVGAGNNDAAIRAAEIRAQGQANAAAIRAAMQGQGGMNPSQAASTADRMQKNFGSQWEVLANGVKQYNAAKNAIANNVHTTASDLNLMQSVAALGQGKAGVVRQGTLKLEGENLTIGDALTKYANKLQGGAGKGYILPPAVRDAFMKEQEYMLRAYAPDFKRSYTTVRDEAKRRGLDQSGDYIARDYYTDMNPGGVDAYLQAQQTPTAPQIPGAPNLFTKPSATLPSSSVNIFTTKKPKAP